MLELSGDSPGRSAGPVSCPSTPVAHGPSVWRCSYEVALQPVDSPISNNGPYAIRQGAIAAVCVHEAAHAVAIVSMGDRLDSIEVALDFERAYGGGVAASVRGRCKLKVAEPSTSGTSPSSVKLLWNGRFHFCWRAFLKRAVIMCAGPAGEMKFRSLAGLPHAVVGASDRDALDRTGRFVWNTCGRDGIGFARLAWSAACSLMDVPLIWKAIAAVEGELFSGLLRLEPANPQPGDSVKFVMPGARAEALIAAAGIALPNIIDVHRCGPECIKPSRKTSRRWERYLAEWASEAPKNAA
jgi:hypothetical protein